MESRIGPHARRLLVALAAMVGVFAMGLLASRAAFAKDGDVIKRAACSGGATAKLKLSHEDGRIEVEFEVDQNRNGVPWRVRVHRPGGRQIFAGTRVTRPPSGSFELRRLTANTDGPDRIRARAVSPSGQVCRITATIATGAAGDGNGTNSGQSTEGESTEGESTSGGTTSGGDDHDGDNSGPGGGGDDHDGDNSGPGGGY
jgi:hypothetical protein